MVGYEGHGCSDMNHIAATKPYCGTRNFVLDATISCSGTNCGAIAPNQHPCHVNLMWVTSGTHTTCSMAVLIIQLKTTNSA